jgi:glycerol-3-phosphate dehydrogenase
VVNNHFRVAIAPADVVWSFAGVRALHDDGAKTAQDTPRDYVLTLDAEVGRAPLLTIIGGKITTSRVLAEAALDQLAPALGARPPWTRDSCLPGGDFPHDRLDKLAADTRRSWSFLEESHARRLAFTYGTRVGRILGSAIRYNDLGPHLGADLTGAEVRYLMDHEFARTADDVVWRRTKLGLRLSREQRERLGSFMADTVGNTTRR